MTLRIGFFEDFKGENTLLICGSPDDISNLADEIESLNQSNINEIVVKENETSEIYLKVSKNRPDKSLFSMVLADSEEVLEVVDKLRVLNGDNPGHQYFYISGKCRRLMVAVNEYTELWWSKNR